MKITVIGASAGVGLETVKRAILREHYVTALSRSSINLPVSDHLTLLQGDATLKENLIKAIDGADAIIVTLGLHNSIKHTTLFSDFATLLIEVAQEKDLKIPVIVLTGFGAGDSVSYQSNFLLSIMFKLLLKDIYADKTKMEEIIAASPLNWVIVRPGILNDHDLTERYRIEDKLYEGMDIGSISRADVADFLVKQAEMPTYLHLYPALSSK